MVVMLAGFSLLLTLDIVGHSETCFFYNSTHSGSITQPLMPVIVIVSIGEMLVFISILEFICAQSPYSMRGLMIGIFFFVYGLFVGFLGIVLFAFAEGFKNYSGKPSCGSWYLMAVIVIGAIGTLLYVIAAKWYRKRQRGGQTNINHQTVVESYYEK